MVALAVPAELARPFSPCSFPLFLAPSARGAVRDGDRRRRQLIARGRGANRAVLLRDAAIGIGIAPSPVGVTFPGAPGRVARCVALVLAGLAAAQAGSWSLPGVLVSRTAHLFLRAGERSSFLRSVAARTGSALAGIGRTGPSTADPVMRVSAYSGPLEAFAGFASAAVTFVTAPAALLSTTERTGADPGRGRAQRSDSYAGSRSPSWSHSPCTTPLLRSGPDRSRSFPVTLPAG